MTVRWRDKAGSWVRQAFASRPDNVVVQRIAADHGTADPRPAVAASLGGLDHVIWSRLGQPRGNRGGLT